MKGLEPSTFCMASRRSSQLSYIRAKAAVYRGLRLSAMDSDIEGRVRTLWEKAFNGRDLDALDAVTAPGFYNHNALPGTPLRTRGSSAGGRAPVGRVSRRALRDRPPRARRRHGDLRRPMTRNPRGDAARRRGHRPHGSSWRQCHLYRFDAPAAAVEHDAIRDDVGLLRQFVETAPARNLHGIRPSRPYRPWHTRRRGGSADLRDRGRGRDRRRHRGAAPGRGVRGRDRRRRASRRGAVRARPARSGRPRPDAARPRRARGLPARPARPAGPGADAHRARRRGGRARRARRRRRRLHDEAVLAARAGGARPGVAAARRAARRSRAGDGVAAGDAASSIPRRGG